MATDAPWEEIPGGLRLHLRLTPKGGADRIDGIGTDSGGRAHLAARVSAPPDKGKANAALEKLAARALGVPKRDVALVRGQTSRVKVLEVSGDPQALIAALTAAIEG